MKQKKRKKLDFIIDFFLYNVFVLNDWIVTIHEKIITNNTLAASWGMGRVRFL